jgi:hypothetical protein
MVLTWRTGFNLDLGDLDDRVQCVTFERNLRQRLERQPTVCRYYEQTHPKISVYKYLRRDAVHFFLEDEKVRLGTLREYSRQDSRGGVGDPTEIKITPSDIHIADSGAPSAMHGIANLRALKVASISPFGVRNAHITSTVIRANRYIQCYSTEYTPSDLERWRASDGAYDACIRITDIVAFIRCIQRADYLGERRLMMQSIEPFAGPVGTLDDVIYVPFPLDLNRDDFTYMSFHKDRELFSWQKEMRAAWPSQIADDAKPYLLHAPGIARLIERVV